MAFMSSLSSTSEVNTANIQVSTASTPVTIASLNDNTANLSDATVYAFLANKLNRSQLVHEDLEQIHDDDLEEMNLKWQLALLSMRARRYYQRSGKKITINRSDTAGYDKNQFGIYKWYQSLCSETLIKKKQKVRSLNSHKEMYLEPTQNNDVAKLALLKQGDYEIWKLRLEQYFQVQDYALWDVIENGNSFQPVPRTTSNVDGTSTSTIPGLVTIEEKTQKKNDVNASSMLLMALPNEHLLTFGQYKDAKTLFEAIQARFGGNDAIRKIQKILLKQMNKPDLDIMSFDDLYNNFKIVEQEVKISAASIPVTTASLHDNTANLSDATVYAFLANQLNRSQLVHEDLEQIHEDDLEEMDLKSDTAGYDKSKVECFNCHKMGHFARECRSPRHQESKPRNQDNSRKTVNVEETSSKAMVAIDEAGFDWSLMADEEVPTNMALMAFSDSEVLNNKTCSNSCLKNYETLKNQYDTLKVEFNKSEFDLANYKRGLASVEEQLVF
ncbi:ribonuclease H-like domain-containing protein [Tanacetum coccineum]